MLLIILEVCVTLLAVVVTSVKVHFSYAITDQSQVDSRNNDLSLFLATWFHSYKSTTIDINANITTSLTYMRES